MATVVDRGVRLGRRELDGDGIELAPWHRNAPAHRPVNVAGVWQERGKYPSLLPSATGVTRAIKDVSDSDDTSHYSAVRTVNMRHPTHTLAGNKAIDRTASDATNHSAE